MTTVRRTRTTALVVTVAAVVMLLAAPLLFALQMRHDGVEPHRAVLAVAGPTIVAQALAERSDALAGRPFDARAVRSVAAARDGVREGTAALGVIIDFGQPRDILLVSTTTDPDLVDAFRARLDAISSGFGRQLDVEEVAPSAGDQVGRRTPYVLTFLGVFIGVGLALGLSLVRGPIAATAARGAVRLAGLAVAGAITGAALAATGPGDDLWVRALAGGAVVTVVAWLVLALESVLGLWGLALATAALSGIAVPLLSYVEPVALPDPWREVVPWTPHGAGLDLARDLLFFGSSSGRSWAVLSTWAVVAVLALLAARTHRPGEAKGGAAVHRD